MRAKTDITLLLQKAQAGDAAAKSHVFDVAYEELRRIAHELGSRGAARTLQPTAVVHEAWMKLAPKLDAVSGRVHFFAIASMAMRQVLANHARAKRSAKRGGAWSAVTLDEQVEGGASFDADLVDLSDCLDQLATLHERHARVVELRVFGGLTLQETAEALGVSHATVESDWSMARAWLWRRLAPAT